MMMTAKHLWPAALPAVVLPMTDPAEGSIAGGFDYNLKPTLLTDFRFGYVRYHVFGQPNGIGTSPAKDAGVPGVNVDTNFNSGMPAFFINGYGSNLFKFGYALGVNGCNCPLMNRPRSGIIGRINFAATVTTGKCLIGLTVGSTNRLMKMRIR